MALKDLKSAYSFYTKKGLEPGFRPNEKNKTDFIYNDDLSVSVRPKGFDQNTSQAVSYKPIVSNDAFIISDQGTSTRLSQLGSGTKFPIGPKGQVHEFDIKRTGFSINNKYEDVYNNLSNFGLADTYTKDSPIDDMYNIVKVRDVASRRDFLRQPFILRGIQRDENSDPQRFGPTINLNLPRAGILTATNRMALDVARIGKFLLSPEGLLFNARQFGQQLMNPNVEGINGKPGKIFNVNSTKLYTPINLMANVAGGYLGLRSRRHGLLPFGNNPSMPGKYEDVFKQRGAIISKNRVNHNRLVRIGNELGTFQITLDRIEEQNRTGQVAALLKSVTGMARNMLGFEGQVINTLTGITGPGSVGGIGRTTITRAVDTPAEQSKFNSSEEDTRQFRNVKRVNETKDETTATTGQKEKALKDRKYDDKKLNESKVGDVNSYKTLTYGAIKKLAKDRTPKSKQIIDFRTAAPYSDTTVEKYNSTSPDDTFCAIIFSAPGFGTAKFKAYLTSMSDSIGNAAQIKQQDGGSGGSYLEGEGQVTRSFQISFLLAATTEDELPLIYRELNKLIRIASRDKEGNPIRITIGNYFKRKDNMYLDTVDISWDTEYPWDIKPGQVVPKVVEINVQLTQQIDVGSPVSQAQLSYQKI